MRSFPPFLIAVLLLFVVGCDVSAQSCSWAPVGAGAPGAEINDLVVFDDGTGPALYAGGFSASPGGGTVGYLARWDGSAWSSVGNVSGATVNALCVFDDGNGPALYIGGSFSSVGGVTAGNVARWDGTSWSSVGGAGGQVTDLIEFDDGSGPGLYAACGVCSVLKWDGTTTWNPVGGIVSLQVLELAVFDDGTGPALYVVGSIQIAGGTPVSNIARWDGTAWSSVGGGVSGGFAMSVTTFDDGTGPCLYVGGTHGTAGGVPVSNISRWDGTTWSDVGGGVNGAVVALAAFDDGTGPALYAGGGFTMAGSVPTSGIAKWDGSAWSPLSSGLSGGSGSQVIGIGCQSGPCGAAMAVFDDGTGPALYVGGDFATAGGITTPGVARWDCGGRISISATQPGGPGAPIYINNSNLTPRRVYHNIFSLDLCPGGLGTGPVLGGCLGPNVQFVINQLMYPVGTAPFHVVAPSSYVTWGPFGVGPITVDAICFDFTGGVIGSTSQVVRLTAQ